MKALTICQPYAELIMLPDDDDRAKRVENRKWPTNYRGPLLIHAGKSREWLDLDDAGEVDVRYGLPLSGMEFGAIVGVCKLAACFAPGVDPGEASARRRFTWLAIHQHVEGPARRQARRTPMSSAKNCSALGIFWLGRLSSFLSGLKKWRVEAQPPTRS